MVQQRPTPAPPVVGLGGTNEIVNDTDWLADHSRDGMSRDFMIELLSIPGLIYPNRQCLEVFGIGMFGCYPELRYTFTVRPVL